MAACGAMIVVVGLINYVFLVEQKQSIVYVQSKLPTEAEQSATLHDKVFIRLDKILKNMSTKISELEEGHRQQKARITQLEVAHEQYQAKILELQVQLVQLKREDSELEGDIKHVNITLAMKDQQDVNRIMDTITTLREKGKELVTTVETLQTSKADQSSLDNLKHTVDHLRQTMATESELNSLNEKVTRHITSYKKEHDQLGSRISDNDRDIQSIQNRIGTVESDIEELKREASQECTKWLWWCTSK